MQTVACFISFFFLFFFFFFVSWLIQQCVIFFVNRCFEADFEKQAFSYKLANAPRKHRKIGFLAREYKSIAQAALYECSRFVVGHRTCAPRGFLPENKWDSIEDLIIRLRWKGRLGQNDAEIGERETYWSFNGTYLSRFFDRRTYNSMPTMNNVSAFISFHPLVHGVIQRYQRFPCSY